MEGHLLLGPIVIGLMFFVSAMDTLSLPTKISETNDTSEVVKDLQTKGDSAAPKVKVMVDYETLCPDSMGFVKNQLWSTYQKLGSIIEVELVPWGKASYKGHPDSWTFVCQHGAHECLGNKIHACVIDATDINTALKFVYCSMAARDPVGASENCAVDAGLDWNKISGCANGPQGGNLLQKHGVRTEQLSPQLFFVPWITINDKFDEAQLDRSLSDLSGVVCDAYQGPKPDACTKH